MSDSEYKPEATPKTAKRKRKAKPRKDKESTAKKASTAPAPATSSDVTSSTPQGDVKYVTRASAGAPNPNPNPDCHRNPSHCATVCRSRMRERWMR